MQADPNIKTGTVVQIDPEHHLNKLGFFAGCFMVVTSVRGWGCQGYIAMPTERGKMPGMAYYRAKWDEIEVIGKAEWLAREGPAEGATEEEK